MNFTFLCLEWNTEKDKVNFKTKPTQRDVWNRVGQLLSFTDEEITGQLGDFLTELGRDGIMPEKPDMALGLFPGCLSWPGCCLH